MNKLSIFIWLFCFSITSGSSQNIHELVSRLSKGLPKTSGLFNLRHGMICEPDSIHGYGFLTSTDSILGQRQILKKYGSTASTVYTYELMNGGLELYSIDSTVFNTAGQPIFNELWELDEDSNAVILRERTMYYPHEGTVNLDYFFPEAILKYVEAYNYTNAAFDSIISYRKSFFTGVLEPYEKTVNVYSPTGQFIERQDYFRDAFGLMIWFPDTKTKFYHTNSGRVDYSEEYSHDGANYVLEKRAEYTYDTNDSLKTINIKNVISGLEEEKLEMSYDEAENSTSAKNYLWDEQNQQWVEVLKLLGDYDDQGRLEVFEFVLDFFGSKDGTRFEYIYQEDSPCPWFINIYFYDSGEVWTFAGKYYYFPYNISSIQTHEGLEWSVFPNPAKDGIMVKAPRGTLLQILNLQGALLYKGISSGNEEFIQLNNAPEQIFLSAQKGNLLSSQIIIVQK